MKLWYVLIVMLVAGLTYSYWFGYTPPLFGVLYFIASLLSYYLYAKDKKAAQCGTWRVPEKTLQLSALFGGWLGAIIGQRTLRHKTQKVGFRVVFFIMLSLNVSLLLWLHSPNGAQKLYAGLAITELWIKKTSNYYVSVNLLLNFRFERKAAHSN